MGCDFDGISGLAVTDRLRMLTFDGHDTIYDLPSGCSKFRVLQEDTVRTLVRWEDRLAPTPSYLLPFSDGLLFTWRMRVFQQSCLSVVSPSCRPHPLHVSAAITSVKCLVTCILG
ncbi:hypothetical protein BDQ94DRAFT_149575 [Aspergillus welwitschiae]|uniref:Uncharacterized protein n=1 Tax=Aspergillus welwitschiae TaxID=1341132 RepID=A0A3F3PT99_9EURO|nr:hypothetical protein BDQ94DRAFT_149575 [Aspergillus welwitschiae]RDH30105.1 hypothetical protein BDQ94DRAFT_149575 [Aspergillus welwitschiae]